MKYALLVAFAALLFCGGQTNATDYYVDSLNGDDSALGTNPGSAWNSIARVNRAALKPGDSVKFRRGRVWRGSLRCQSGEKKLPIVYSDYGAADEINMPRIINSVDLTGQEKWTLVAEQPKIWATRMVEREDLGVTKVARSFAHDGVWGVYAEGDADADCVKKSYPELGGVNGFSLVCKKSGSSPNFLQFTNQGFPIRAGSCVELRFKARASVPFNIDANVNLMMKSRPWSQYGQTVEFPGEVSNEWREYHVLFRTTETAEDARITFFLGGCVPNGCVFDFVPLDAHEFKEISLGLNSDVGNIVLTEYGDSSERIDDNAQYRFAKTYEQREYAGNKRWALEEMKEPNDFWYDEKNRRVYFVSEENPGTLFQGIEAALRENTCVCSCNDVVIENICFSHTAAHGISLPTAKRVVVRDCVFDWIGGGDLYAQGGKGKRVRYGNGVEFWDGLEDCLVERCRFSRVYDVAVTTQGPLQDVARNLVVRDCVIFRCEQAFEIWFTNAETIVEGLVFERNLCVDCGRGWSHRQRPNKIATPILGYGLNAKKVDVTIRKNIFCDSAQFFIKVWHNRIMDYKVDDNVYWSYPERLHESDNKYFCYNAASGKSPVTFEDFKKETGHDEHSRWMEPLFKDYERDNFTLLNPSELDAGPNMEELPRAPIPFALPTQSE